MNAVPSLFRQMVQRDVEKFKNKIGFQDFFLKETKTVINKTQTDTITPKGNLLSGLLNYLLINKLEF